MVDPRFAEDALGARLVDEHVVHQRAEPALELAGALVLALADHHVPATVVVLCIVIGGDAVFLAPVDLEIGKRLVVVAADQWQHPRVIQHLLQVRGMFIQAAGLLPEERDLLQVHPAVETLQVQTDVHGAQAEGGVQAGQFAAIDLAVGNGWPLRMALFPAEGVAQRHAGGGTGSKPGQRVLPETAARAGQACGMAIMTEQGVEHPLAYGIPCAVEGERGTDFQQRDAGRIAEDLAQQCQQTTDRERFGQAFQLHMGILAAEIHRGNTLDGQAGVTIVRHPGDHAAAVSQKKGEVRRGHDASPLVFSRVCRPENNCPAVAGAVGAGEA